MAKIMEQYMSKTQDDYVSGVVRPKIKDKDNFELKGQFLKELRTNTFSGSDHEDANEHNEKVLEIVDLFHILNITIDQVMLRAFPMSLTGASISTTIEADSHSIRRIGSSQYVVSTGLNSTLLYKSRQMMVPFLSRLDNHYCEEEEEGNYGPKFTKAYGAAHVNNVIPRKEKDPESFTLPFFINDVCVDNALVDLRASVSIMPLSTYLNLGLEDMDAYRDERMGDVIVGEPFLREVGTKTRRFKGMITIYNGNDDVSEKDKMNGISHSYQKLKGFYKGVLNLGPDYIRDAKMEEWLTRGHISVHEME
ncbi:hypothetical protein Tco_1475353 [Tanacetum coccineum]